MAGGLTQTLRPSDQNWTRKHQITTVGGVFLLSRDYAPEQKQHRVGMKDPETEGPRGKNDGTKLHKECGS